MYVIPYVMGPLGSLDQQGRRRDHGQQVRRREHADHDAHGRRGAEAARDSTDFVRGLHSSATSRPIAASSALPRGRRDLVVRLGLRRQRPARQEVHALRIASVMARDEGWLAEHMLILGIEPEGREALRRRRLPERLRQDQPGHARSAVDARLEGRDGRRRHRLDALRRRRPPLRDQPGERLLRRRAGHEREDEPERLATLRKNTIFTNVALTEDGDVWWEGMTKPPPEGLTDWQGKPWTPASGEPAAHPNSRFTAPAGAVPVISRKWEIPAACRSARSSSAAAARGVPLVYEAFDWSTACSSALDDRTRRPPPPRRARSACCAAIRWRCCPFCGYNMARLLRPLARDGQKIREAAEDLPRELVPQGPRTASSSGRASATTCAS
jgi:phosphoenolpyruvate carboxykinase (GTP)